MSLGADSKLSAISCGLALAISWIFDNQSIVPFQGFEWHRGTVVRTNLAATTA